MSRMRAFVMRDKYIMVYNVLLQTKNTGSKTSFNLIKGLFLISGVSL